jgi:surface carbohydrate biosynthesis protein (TIGR04326 family)
MKSSIYIVDEFSKISLGDLTGLDTIYWSQKTDILPEKSSVSVSEKLSANELYHREEYSNFIKYIGEIRYKKRTLIQSLTSLCGHCFWWSSTLAEMHPIKSTSIYRIFKYYQLIELLVEKRVQSIYFCVRDDCLYEVLKEWCSENGIQINNINILKKRNFFSIFEIGKYLLFAIKILYAYKNKSILKNNTYDFLILTYYPNLIKTNDGSFKSAFFSDLHTLFLRKSLKIKWIWLNNESNTIAGIKENLETRDAFQSKTLTDSYQFIYEYLTLWIIYKTIIEFIYIQLRLPKKNWLKTKFLYSRDKLNIWKFLEADWNESFMSASFLINIMNAFLYREVIKKNKLNTLYIYENNSWEKDLLQAFEINRPTNKIVGIQHTTINTLHLSNFISKQYLIEGKIYDPHFFPDFITVNGKDAFSKLADWGYPANRLVSVEAHRYLGLETQVDSINSDDLLLLTDYQLDTSLFAVNVALNYLKKCKPNLKIFIKEHPFCKVVDMIPLEDRSYFTIIDNTSASILIKSYKNILCSNLTSCAAEAMQVDKNVMVTINPNGLNLSPLYGTVNFNFIKNYTDLEAELLRAKHDSNCFVNRHNFFNLDSKLTLWDSFLSRLLN